MDAQPINDVFVPDCPGRLVLDHVTSWWATLVIGALADGPLRFYLLRDRVGGISEKMLSQNLRILARDGLVAREVEPDSPPKVTYRLTPLGEELAAHLSGLIGWIAGRTADIMAAQECYDEAKAAS